ncbi:MAG: hypothetical protein IH931_05355 [candidate division Zixibacteria bacterium]|nr:hypothetical protein [candidate division Zixibacteria bacterium]
MKRLISVLAIALILTMMSWGTANSVDAPEKLIVVNYDHPWGGEHDNGDFPGPIPEPIDPTPDVQRSSNFRSWITNWFFNSIYYLNFLQKGNITIDVIEDTNTNNDATNYNYKGTGK